MVAIIRCTREEESLLAGFHSGRELEQGWESTGSRDNWKKSHLALVLTGSATGRPVVSFIAHAKSGRAAATLVRKIAVTRLHAVHPALPWDELLHQLPLTFRDKAADRTGILTQATGREVRDALTTLRPQLTDAVAALERHLGVARIFTRARELYAYERDATATALDLAGFDRGVVALAEIPEDPDAHVPALQTIPSLSAHEDHLIAHDAQRFATWIGGDADHLATRVFRRGDQRLFLANVNRRPLEETLGVDLIYYHAQRDSFVLVQYKKMTRTGSAQEWSYYCDQDMDAQLERMRLVDEKCATQDETPPVDYRLSANPCWIKLCKDEPTIPEGDKLIGGMYLSREHFAWLRDHPVYATGPRKGTVFGYHTVPRYLDNTTFIQHVRDGWIGSRGTGSTLVEAQIQESQAGGRGVVFAARTGEDVYQAQRTSERRANR